MMVARLPRSAALPMTVKSGGRGIGEFMKQKKVNVV